MIQRKEAKLLLAESIIDLMKKRQLDRIKVSDIAKNCMMSRVSFYYHFVDKYDLIQWIYEDQMYEKTVLDFKGIGTKEYIAELCTNWIRYFKENRDFIQNAFNDNHPKGFHNIVINCAFRVVSSHAKYSLGTDQLSEEMLCHLRHYIYGKVNIVEDWIRKGMLDSDKHIGEMMAKAMPDSIKKIYFIDEKNISA